MEYDTWIEACIKEADALVKLNVMTGDEAAYCTQYLDGEFASLGYLSPTDALDTARDLIP